MTDDPQGTAALAEALHDALYAALREAGYDPDLRVPATAEDDLFADFARRLGTTHAFVPLAEIERLRDRIVRLDSGLRESAEARHSIAHLRQEATGDSIDFEHCYRAGCVSARAALRPEPATREQVEQAFIDGSVEGSPIDRDGLRPEPAPEQEAER